VKTRGKKFKVLLVLAVLVLVVSAVGFYGLREDANVETPADMVQTAVGELYLPATDSSGDIDLTNFLNITLNYSNVVGWPNDKMPVAPEGFTVTKFAGDLISPRNIYTAPNGDVFAAEANKEVSGFQRIQAWYTGDGKSRRITESAKRITKFRDADKDGVYETRSIFLSNLNQPFGMLVIGDYFYVANTDGLWRYPYKGETVMTAQGEKILDLPAGGYNNHWTRNIVANRDKTKIYVSVGSGSNVGENGAENEVRRAGILEINPDGNGERIYASGLRNPVGMDWATGTDVLWTAVNERDGLGDDLVPDYLTSVKDGGFYGWYYSYWGKHPDPRVKDQKNELVQQAIAPDVPLGAHTASLGLAFYNGTSFPEKYRGGAFVGQHGSWNRSEFSGYKVVFVPFANGRPAGKPEDFLTGFLVGNGTKDVYGRPVGVALLPDGSLLVADDAASVIWRVSKNK
jgi:glucose/arabinose dehydrogenase